MTINHLGDLKPDKNNARKHNSRNIGMVERSLETDGFGRSILLDAGGNIIAGNGVTEAAGNVGLEDVLIVPSDGTRVIAIQRTDVQPGSERAVRLAIADNRANELSDFDPAVVAALADEVDLSDFWRDDELDALLAGMATEDAAAGDDPGAQIDRGAALAAEYGVEPNQLWVLGPHRLIVGDCTDAATIARLMDGHKADAVVTDPPYGIERAGVLNDDPEGLRHLFDGALAAMPARDAVVIAFQSPRLFPVWIDAVRDAGHAFERALWFYDETDMTFPWRGWLMTSQIALVSSIGKPRWNEAGPYHHDCYIVKTAGKQDDSGGHPTAKPLDVVEDLIAHTNGLVYEPFAGSGTTIIACEHQGRTCYAAELSPAYAAVAMKRWADMTGLTPRLVARDGTTE